MLSAACNAISRRARSTAEPRCGVNTVSGWESSRGSIARGRFGRAHFEDVGCVAAERPPFQCVGDRGFVDDRSAPDIDEKRAGFMRLSASRLIIWKVSAESGTAKIR